MKTTQNDFDMGSEIEYDLVIVGGGPSAIGLIYGLLLPYENNEKASSSTQTPPFTIAVIERGTSLETPPSNDVQDPNMWFRAAHPTSLHTKGAGHTNADNHRHGHRYSGIASNSSVEYQTVPQQGLGNRIVSVPTGKGMGGGTNINALLVVRPPLDDFQNWPKYWTEPVTVDDKDEQESHTAPRPRIMAAVIKVENEMKRNEALVQETCDSHGTQIMTSMDGKWVENKFVFEKCIDTDPNVECSLNLEHLCAVTSAVRKIKRGDETGKTGNYRRMNYYEGILKPFLERNPHLKEAVRFITGVQAERLIHHQHENTTQISIKGVDCERVDRELDQDGRRFTIKGNHVVLSAGAILTPLLLLVSGIGAEDDLKKEGIEPVMCGENNQWGGIGKRLCDHVVTACSFLAINPLSNGNREKEGRQVNSVRGWLAADIDSSDESGEKSHCTSRVMFTLTDGSSSVAILPSVISGFFRRKCSFKPPWSCNVVNKLLQIASNSLFIMLSFLLSISSIRYLFSIYTMQFLVCLMNPSSKGSIKIRKKQRHSDADMLFNAGMSCYYPEIDPQYLSDESDCRRLGTGWRVLRRFTRQWSLGKVEVLPGILYRVLFGSVLLTRYHADFALPFYHWSGTCAMKCSLVDEKDYVVDEQLRVRNIVNLYICDASVNPDILSVPPALTLAAMGLASSEIIQTILHKKKE